MNIRTLLLGSALALFGWVTTAFGVPSPTPLEKMVSRASWIVIGELGELRPASVGAQQARHGDIRVEEVLKAPRGSSRPRHLTLFTIDPKLLDTPDAPIGVIYYKPGQRGIWLLEPLEDGVYRATNPNSFLAVQRRAEVDRLLAIGTQPSRATPNGQSKVIVAADGSGDCRTVAEAVASVAEGGEIRLRPGLYREAVHMDKSVTVLGEGPREKIVIQSTRGDCIYLEAEQATIKNLTLRCEAAPEAEFYAVDVAAGNVLLEDCDLSSRSLACLGVHDQKTKAVVRNCRIHGGNDAGVFVYEGGLAELQGCEIFGNFEGNVVVWAGAEVRMNKCVLHSSRDVGLDVRKGGRATLVDCQINRNKGGPLSVQRKAKVSFVRCTIGTAASAPMPPTTNVPDPKPRRDLREVIRVLQDGDSTKEQLDAAVSQLMFGDKEAVPVIQNLLTSESPSRRMSGCYAAQKIGSAAEPVVPTLITLLREDTNFLRWMGAASALGRTGTQNPEAVKVLTEALRSPNEIIREGAVAALQEIGLPAAEKAIPELKRLREGDSARRVRVVAAATEASLSRDSEAIDLTVKGIPVDAHSILCRQMATAIGIVGPKQDVDFATLILSTQLKFEKTEGREEIAFALARMRPKLEGEKQKNIELALKNKEPKLRWYAAVTLLSHSDHAAARKECQNSLSTMIEYHRERIAEMNYPDRTKRTFFCEICEAFPELTRDALPLLRRIAVESPDSDSREWATRALAKFGETISGKPNAEMSLQDLIAKLVWKTAK